jgi:hypothetical protein
MEINNAKLQNKLRIKIKTEIERHRNYEEHPDAPVAVAAAAKENEKTEAEMSTPDEVESLCDPEVNVPVNSVAVSGQEFQDKTKEKPSEPDSNNLEHGPVWEIESSGPKPDQFERNKTEAISSCSNADGNGREREIDGKTLETTVEGKVDNVSGVQATEDQKDTAEGPASVEEVTAADTRTFRTENFKIGLREREG